MTLNLRYGNANDGQNSWDKSRGSGSRREIVFELLRQHQPEILCTQEGLHDQILDVAGALKGFDWIGIGREGGKKGEYCAIFYDKSRLSLHEENTFWLSRTPDVVGSKSWGSKLPRIVTWGHFHVDDLPSSLYLFNTHFSNESRRARNQSAKLLKRSIQNLTAKEAHTFITGDFNSSPDSNTWKILTGGQFQDAWLSAEHQSGPDFTFHGFDGLHADETVRKRIDWILYRSPGLKKPEMVKITPYRKEKRYPSDHFPVLMYIKNLDFKN